MALVAWLLLPVTGAPMESLADDLDDQACADAATLANGATEGAGDAALPTLSWAALKTGFRAVVAWQSGEVTQGTVRYRIDGGAAAEQTEAVPTDQHVFVFDDLPVGGQFCFVASDGTGAGAVHSFALRNAWTTQPATGSPYSINLLVQANEAPSQSYVMASLDRFADVLWDATDGHVRAGRIVLVSGNTAPDAGQYACRPGSLLPGHRDLPDSPAPCDSYDVLFTHDATTTGAAATMIDGISKHRASIWMRAPLQTFDGLDDPGLVLLHEIGHYAFGMPDLYDTSATVPTASCYVPALRISIMGGSRDATEFDDDVAKCPQSKPVSSWALLRQRYTAVPDRPTGPQWGPSGNGGGYALSTYLRPDTSGVEAPGVWGLLPQDDARSGRDAPGGPDPSFLVHPGWQATGTLGAGDAEDWYAVQGQAGAALTLDSELGCLFAVVRADGTALPSTCAFAAPYYRVSAVLPTDDVVYLRAAQAASRYWFVFAIGEPSPGLDPQGLACAPGWVQASATGPSEVHLAWTGSAGASGYGIYRAAGQGPATLVGQTTALGWTDPGVAPDTAYRYSVTATVGPAEMPSCGEVSVRTPA